ncbi:hypothetical protein GCM10023080_072250 [Streptomyces pseudoechinosporeus]
MLVVRGRTEGRRGKRERAQSRRRSLRRARRLTRTPQLPLLNAALTGAIILVTADLAARTALPPLEIPVGALTALVGGPYLLWLLAQDRTLRS